MIKQKKKKKRQRRRIGLTAGLPPRWMSGQEDDPPPTPPKSPSPMRRQTRTRIKGGCSLPRVSAAAGSRGLGLIPGGGKVGVRWGERLGRRARVAATEPAGTADGKKMVNKYAAML